VVNLDCHDSLPGQCDQSERAVIQPGTNIWVGTKIWDRLGVWVLPEPINTDHVVLDDSVRELTELLARNAHDIWARQRLADGWRFGPRRDDAKKEHPCLVPYEDLPESEKEYDRKTSMETLKAIVALGYQIKKA
jgi:ryanodine receptor 2